MGSYDEGLGYRSSGLGDSAYVKRSGSITSSESILGEGTANGSENLIPEDCMIALLEYLATAIEPLCYPSSHFISHFPFPFDPPLELIVQGNLLLGVRHAVLG